MKPHHLDEAETITLDTPRWLEDDEFGIPPGWESDQKRRLNDRMTANHNPDHKNTGSPREKFEWDISDTIISIETQIRSNGLQPEYKEILYAWEMQSGDYVEFYFQKGVSSDTTQTTRSYDAFRISGIVESGSEEYPDAIILRARVENSGIISGKDIQYGYVVIRLPLKVKGRRQRREVSANTKETNYLNLSVFESEEAMRSFAYLVRETPNEGSLSNIKIIRAHKEASGLRARLRNMVGRLIK